MIYIYILQIIQLFLKKMHEPTWGIHGNGNVTSIWPSLGQKRVNPTYQSFYGGKQQKPHIQTGRDN